MDAKQIEQILRKLMPPTCAFLGVFSRDTLPRAIIRYPACYVTNTDKAREPGSHWVAVFMPSSSSLEYFDSYGWLPDAYGLNVSPSHHNSKCLQSLGSNVCGQYCIYLLYRRSHGRSLTSILKHFSSSNLRWNDFQVARWVRKHFAITNPKAYASFNCYGSTFKVGSNIQSCKSKSTCFCPAMA